MNLLIILRSFIQSLDTAVAFIMFPLMACFIGWIVRSIVSSKDVNEASTIKNIIYNFLVGTVIAILITLADFIGCNGGGIPMKPD